MRLEKEEKRRVKRLFVGILVMTLLVTMLPYGGAGRFMVEAADTTQQIQGLQDLEEFKDATVVLIEQMDADTFVELYPELEHLYTEMQSQFPKEAYPNGIPEEELFLYLCTKASEDNKMILKLTGNLNLSDVKLELGDVPSGAIGIDLGEYTLAVSDIYSICDTVDCYFYGSIGTEGNRGTVCGCYKEVDETVTLGELYQSVYPKGNCLYFMGDIDVSNVCFTVQQGGNLVINDLDLSVPVDGTIVERYYQEGFLGYRCEEIYEENAETGKSIIYYELLGEENFTNEVVSGDIETEERFFDITTFYYSASEGYEEVVFEKGVIPEDVTIICMNNSLSLYSHSNADYALRINDKFGVYHIVDETEIAIDIVEMIPYSNKIQMTDTGDYLYLDVTYLNDVEADGYTKVTYTNNSIPKRYIEYSATNSTIGNYDIKEIIFHVVGPTANTEPESPMESPKNVDLHFELEAGRNIPIVNGTEYAVTASNDVPVWVLWSGIREYGVEDNTKNFKATFEEGALRDEETETPDDGTSTPEDGTGTPEDGTGTPEDGTSTPEETYPLYIKAGSKITLEPNPNMCIYDLYWGYNIYANAKYFEYCTNGNINVTVPAFALSNQLSFRTGEVVNLGSVNLMSEEQSPIEVLTVSESEEEDDTNGTIKWFGEALKIKGRLVTTTSNDGLTSMNEYVICDEKNIGEDAIGWSDSEITISEEGRITKTFYVMDVYEEVNSQTLEVVPSSNYGARGTVTYTYVLDTASPTISSVKAEDSAGIVMTLEDLWCTESEPFPAPVWTNQPTVTLTVNAEQGDGLDIVKYEFHDQYGETITESNVHTVSEDGAHEIEIYVRDEFDEAVSRISGYMFKTTIGIDTTAPTLLFTDAKKLPQSVLSSYGTYEGNLHLVCDDGNGSGFSSMNLEKKDGENWVASNELLVKTETGYYIAPTTQNEVYRIKVIDAVGNETTYENITVAGYTQDVSIAIGSATTTYGNELAIPVTITNAGENPLQISLFALREDATDAVFDKEIGTIKELAKDEFFTVTVKIPEGTDAGNYDAMLDIQYTSVGGSLETNIAKAYSYQIQATIAKAKGVGSANIPDFYYGETINTEEVTSTTNGTENVTIYYKEVDKDESFYVTIPPKAVGTYNVKAVFPATANYKELVMQNTFTISRMKATDDMYVVDTKADENGVYKEPVVIKGQNGYVLSTSEDGTFTETLTITDSTESYVFYVKTSTGAITEAIDLGKIVIDNTGEEPAIPEPEQPEDNTPEVVTGGKVSLEQGKAYTFGKGTWTVNGDSTSYAGDITFYVPKSGDYEFTQE